MYKIILLFYLMLLSLSLCRADIITICSSQLLTNNQNVQFVAYLKDTNSDTNYSDIVYVEYGTNFNTAVDNGNKKIKSITPNCDPQIWAESDGATTKIRMVECSKLAVYNPDNLNHYIQISRDLIKWDDVLITYNIIKAPTDESMAFFRIRP